LFLQPKLLLQEAGSVRLRGLIVCIRIVEGTVRGGKQGSPFVVTRTAAAAAAHTIGDHKRKLCGAELAELVILLTLGCRAAVSKGQLLGLQGGTIPVLVWKSASSRKNNKATGRHSRGE
jgi:hypothetical protein